MAPSAIFDLLRETAAGQVVAYNDATLSAFLAAVRAERTDGSASYAIAADGASKLLQMRNHDDDAWIPLWQLDSGGKYITNRFGTSVEITDDSQITGASASEQALTGTEVTIAANDQTTKTVYRGEFAGYVNVAGFGGWTWRFRLRHGGTGGTLLGDSANLTDPGSGTYGWCWWFNVAVDVLGGSGTGKCWAQSIFFNGFNSTLKNVYNAAVVNYQTDASKTLGLTAQISGGASSSDLVVVTNGRIERKA